MTEASLQVLSQTLQSEFDALRDQRDLYRSLLLSEPEPLAIFMDHSLETVESIRTTLRMQTRDAAAFRGKIERLQMELIALEQALTGMNLPTVSWRLQNAAAAVHDIGLRAEISGNALLPVMVLLEELCTHLLIAAETAAVHLPPGVEQELEEAPEGSEQRAQQRLATALQQMSDKLAAQFGKSVSLVTVGLEDIPEAWGSALFDLLGQLLRNTVEHGIEAPIHRAALSKPETGTLAVDFVERGAQGYELNVQDDGAGLDPEGIAESAVKLGLLTPEAARSPDKSRLVNLIFQPGVTTAQNPARRGMGMQIVRDHVHRLGGKLQIGTRRGQFLRLQITLPALNAP
jgi:two-component system, chemotaxis family, sensor kinase CheA